MAALQTPRVYNFSAGPGVLPAEALAEARESFLDYRGTGVSVMELSHRSKAFEEIIQRAESDLRELLAIPEGYRVLFLQGGASMQFAMIPQAFLAEGETAAYVITGAWGKKALESAKPYGDAKAVYDGKDEGYRSVPDSVENAGTAYTHVTSNETIQGVQFHRDLEIAGPQVCDMSSDILSRPVDVSRYSLIYAGAQKNMGPAGLTVAIVSEEFLSRHRDGLPPMFDYRVQVENGSLYNTPPTWSIYVTGLVFRYLLDRGGLAAAAERNERKAKILYDAIDVSEQFYIGHALPQARSKMNVTFNLRDDVLTKAFLGEAEGQGMIELKGHRSVGGCRASIYNAFPEEGCQALADLMRDFAQRNG